MEQNIIIHRKDALIKRYKLRHTGAEGSTIEITLPKEAVEREARRLGISEKAAVAKLMGVWRFNSFKGLHLDFELKEASKSEVAKAGCSNSLEVNERTKELNE